MHRSINQVLRFRAVTVPTGWFGFEGPIDALRRSDPDRLPRVDNRRTVVTASAEAPVAADAVRGQDRPVTTPHLSVNTGQYLGTDDGHGGDRSRRRRGKNSFSVGDGGYTASSSSLYRSIFPLGFRGSCSRNRYSAGRL